MTSQSLAALPGLETPWLVGMLEYAFAPQRFAERNAKRLGRVYRARGQQGALVVTSAPEHVRRVFAADSDTFDTFAQFTLAGILGTSSVLVTAGATHRRQRKLLSPPMSGTRLRAFSATMQEIADRQVGALTPGQTVRALDVATRFTLEVIVRTVFGATQASEAAELTDILHEMVGSLPVLPIFEPRLQKGWYPPWARHLRAKQRFEVWLQDKLAARRKAPGAADDVLSLLLEARNEDERPMEYAELRDQLLTLLLAGHETTSVALASCLEQIHRNPSVLQRLLDELASAPPGPDEAQRLAYLGATVDETLRIAPIVSDVARRVRQPFWLDDQLQLEPGEGVLVLIEALHRDEALYPEPWLFRPERFLERKYASYEYVPFGGGVRRCLGAAFSDYETRILLATLLRQVRLELERPRPDPRIRRNITLGPKYGVPMRVVERRRA